jgi:hypothetical protein
MTQQEVKAKIDWNRSRILHLVRVQRHMQDENGIEVIDDLLKNHLDQLDELDCIKIQLDSELVQ